MPVEAKSRGGCRAGCRLKGRLMFSWGHVQVNARRLLGFALGATGCFNVMMQKFYFAFAAASLHKVDSVMLWVQKMIHGKIKDSLFHFHPAPRLIKEC